MLPMSQPRPADHAPRYIQRKTTIPVPRVRAFGRGEALTQDQPTTQAYLLLDYVPRREPGRGLPGKGHPGAPRPLLPPADPHPRPDALSRISYSRFTDSRSCWRGRPRRRTAVDHPHQRDADPGVADLCSRSTVPVSYRVPLSSDQGPSRDIQTANERAVA